MKIWLIVSILLLPLCWLAFKATDRPGDDFGAVVPVVLLLGATALNWIVLIVASLVRALS